MLAFHRFLDQKALGDTAIPTGFGKFLAGQRPRKAITFPKGCRNGFRGSQHIRSLRRANNHARHASSQPHIRTTLYSNTNMNVFFISLAIFAMVAGQNCPNGTLACGDQGCYAPSQYTCGPDAYSGATTLCPAGTSPCNGNCIADCGYYCNTTTGQVRYNSFSLIMPA